MRARLARFIRSGGTDGDFNRLALDLWAWQINRNLDYAAISAGTPPESWAEIPAVPVRLFRDLPLTSFPADQARVIFRTSGTTGGRGVVRLRDTELYDLGARAHAEAVVGPIPKRGASLVGRLADSSLAHMCWQFSPELRPFFDRRGGVRGADLRAHLADLDGPAFVPGTAFAFAELLAQENAPIPLQPGSVVMVTGGFKGRAVRVSAAQLTAQLGTLFPGAKLVGEYGMSELSSQLWSQTLGGAFVPPPWMRVQAVDPGTGLPARVGLLRFFDLASIDTVVAIETGDLGEVLDDGSVALHGRHAGTPLRGCSLTVEEALRPPRPPAPPVESAIPPRPYGPGPDAAGDAGRVVSVLAALKRLRRIDAGPLGQGLSPENAAECLGLAVGAVRGDALLTELATPGARPPDVTIVAAWGVFTSPLEWAALYAAAGMRVHIKAPNRDPAFCMALADAFAAEGLPVTASASRDLGSPSVVVAFGSDTGVADVVAATPGARHVSFGHRFSAVLCRADPIAAQGLAWEHALYDTRGCMAPVAVFVPGDPAPIHDALVQHLALAEAGLPAGPRDPSLGPEWRRRLGLARATGRVTEGAQWAVATLPADHFVPSALPRLVTLHPIDGGAQMEQVLHRWRHSLSSLSTDDVRRPIDQPDEWAAVYSWFPRVTTVASLQRPSLPRRHDRVSMLGCVLDPPVP